ncbi:hypothetical protein B7H23_00575 [Notoacmeibacter marinus]|uniref:DUF945 domain-containing protein n=1 Tax=Notoacmeibacter marinus TaxID=1876515 RepID=A0A231V062_9HYPH|nr:hypothetical protein [Notoacmeibacter marinus]OXT01510.1 hypothetical protein B7H23_00575 [Notoacmeibacter marinus]
MRHILLTAGLSLAFAPVLALPAWAVDAQAVSDRLVELLNEEGFDVEIGSATEDGDDVVLGDVRFGEGDKQFSYDEIRLENVSEQGDYFLIERTELPAKTVDMDDNAKMDLSSISLEKLQLLRQDDPEHIAPLQLDAFQMERMSISVPAGEFLVLEDLAGAGMTYDPEKPMEATGSVGSFVLDTQIPFGPNKDESAAMRKQLADLGYSTIKGRGEGSGRYDPQSGVMSFAQRMEFTDAASLQFEGEVSAATPELMRELQKADRKVSRIDDIEKQNKAMIEDLAPLYGQLVLETFSLRLQDASLTNKLIGIAAERQNAAPEQLKLQMAMMAPALLASYVPAELAQKVGEALQTYLNDPQSLSITIEPKDGTTIGQISDMVRSNPKELPAVLNPDITANQD